VLQPGFGPGGAGSACLSSLFILFIPFLGNFTDSLLVLNNVPFAIAGGIFGSCLPGEF